MKRLNRRTAITLVLVAGFLAGVLFFCVQLFRSGNDWVGFFGTTYYESGAIYDSKGVKLYDGQTGEYAEDWSTRVSTLHLIGDRNFGTSLRSVLASRLTGYNPVTGTTLGSHDVTLTVDGSLNAAAYNALNGRKGVVAVYNYLTGDMECLVSAPSYDPLNPPGDINENPAYEGAYLNRFFSATYTPGSIFKIVTTAAAIEKKKDLDAFTFSCTGTYQIGEDTITCPYAHGQNMNIDQCLASSCNGAYAQLALELGGDTLEKYMETAGLMDSLEICDISTARGSFEAAPDGSSYLGWSGVGQYKDLVNPCTMLTFLGGIANRGIAVVPQLVEKETLSGSAVPAAFPDGTDSFKIYDEATCDRLKQMLRNNVVSQYGQSQFGELPVCAKSGTAEVGGDKQPHAWFVGFVDDVNTPLAFLVLVENGGSGASVAGSVAAQVLAKAAAN